MNFSNSSTAGGTSSTSGATIFAGDYDLESSGGSGVFTFTDSSTAAYSNISIGDSSGASTGIFVGTSSTSFPTADHAFINVGNLSSSVAGSLNFANYATADASTIVVGDFSGTSVLNFTTHSTAGGTSSTPGSQITVGDFTGSTGSIGELNFSDNTTAAYSTIQVGNVTLSSPNNLSATNSSNFPLGAGPTLSTVNFEGSSSTAFSTADHANITVGVLIISMLEVMGL